MNNINLVVELCQKLGCKCIENESMSQYTSFKVGGKASIIVFPHKNTQINEIQLLCKSQSMPYYIMGRGSNIIVKDEGYDGVIICLNELKGIQLQNNTYLSVSAGEPMTAVCNFALKNGLTGLEFAYGIPGSVGGCIAMNAGAYGGEMKDIVCSVKILYENEILTLSKNAMNFSYRNSIALEKNLTVLEATFELKKANNDDIKNKMRELMLKRKDKQPLDYPSAGSTFKRPHGAYAAQLIEECNLKGISVGGAKVSEKHSGFIINYNNATCNDIIELIDIVKEKVFEQTGYKLECEVRII